MSEPAPALDAAIAAILPHRYPFLLVDRVLAIEPEKRIVAIKNITGNEPYLSPHGVGEAPVYPRVLMMESIAQTGAILLRSRPEYRQRLVFFLGMDRVRFRGDARVGDVVEFEVRVRQFRGNSGRFTGTARVGSRIIVTGSLRFALAPDHQAPGAATVDSR
jgi:3-hydroxymyristoyl/3-hydroxydecanoyl-(acyl carrier protein) dehydratase